MHISRLPKWVLCATKTSCFRISASLSNQSNLSTPSLFHRQQHRYVHIPLYQYGDTLNIAKDDYCMLQRRFTPEDGMLFMKVTGDANPIHQPPTEDSSVEENDSDPPSPLEFWGNQPIVHGMLSASLFSALFASHIPGTIYLSQRLKFLKPVRYQQLVTAKITVLSTKSHPRIPNKTIVECSTTVDIHDSNNETHTVRAIDGEATILIPQDSSKG